MKLGHRKIRARRMGHRSLHKISLGSRSIQHGAKITGKVLKVAGKITGQPELVAAGEGVQQAGKVAGKVNKVSRSLEKVV
jgi:uncharacterized protein YjbJ (UPF0337 family)